MTPPRHANKHQICSERTRQTIVDAAEPLFAPHGYAGASMRQIAAAVGVDLSLVMYHFESKEALYRAVLERIYMQFVDRRIELMDALEQRRANPTVIELFEILITSWFEVHFGNNPHVARLLIRGLNEYPPHNEAEWISDPFAKRFLAALCKAAPQLSREHVHWTLHFLTGAIAYCILGEDRVRRLSPGICNIDSRGSVRKSLAASCRRLVRCR
jgi:AcrR family transcriptional regulator